MKQEDSRSLLGPYITDLDQQVFSIVNLDGLVGAVMARYSRAETGLRETLLREFIKEDKLRLEKAERLIEKVLIAYGDDSVGELEGAHLAMEDISMVATKIIEHRRIGGSPIEKSTRYVRFDLRDESGNFRYVTPPDCPIELKDEYRRVMDSLFETYAQMWEPVNHFLRGLKPIEEAQYPFKGKIQSWQDCPNDRVRNQFEKTYENDLKTKTCDILRAFLPLATKANVGLFGNGRYFQNLISKLLSSPLAEAQSLGQQSFDELSKVIPHYVKRARKLDYLVENHSNMQRLARDLFPGKQSNYGEEALSIEPSYNEWFEKAGTAGNAEEFRQIVLESKDVDFATALIYPYTNWDFRTLREKVRALNAAQFDSIFRACYGQRKTRRDRPERMIEWGYPHCFELVTEWAVYKDLMRHRMGTMYIQPLDPHLGFEMPDELKKSGVLEMAEKAVRLAEELYDKLPDQLRPYSILHGHRVRWMLGMNDRALMHMLELRTTPQGHPNYRRVCQKIHSCLTEKTRRRADEINFVNHDPVFWSRAESEAKQREKESLLGD